MTSTPATREPAEPPLSVRRARTRERAHAGEPEAVAGAGGLDRAVRRAHAAEAAGVGALPEGETVPTTGVPPAGHEGARAGAARSPHRADAATALLGPGPARPDRDRRPDAHAPLTAP